MDAVGVTIVQVQEAWGRGCIVDTLPMDVAAAFPTTAMGYLLTKRRKAGVDECLFHWTDSYMRDRMDIMSVDRQDSEAVSVTTGLP